MKRSLICHVQRLKGRASTRDVVASFKKIHISHLAARVQSAQQCNQPGHLLLEALGRVPVVDISQRVLSRVWEERSRVQGVGVQHGLDTNKVRGGGV